MAQWAAVVSAECYSAERLFAHDTITVAARPDVRPAPGDAALLVADGDHRVVFGLGRVSAADPAGAVRVAYTHRMLDEPLAADGLVLGEPGVHRLGAETYEDYAGKVGAELRVDGPKRTWLVGVDLPIEAASAAEAVRMFWSYVYELGPAQLPAFVAPSDDELAMQAFVGGEEANLDPEEDD
jgi:hypothetical protein